MDEQERRSKGRKVRGQDGAGQSDRGDEGAQADQYQQETKRDVLSYMINAMSPGSRAIAEFKAANARAAGEPAQEPAPTGGELGMKNEKPKTDRVR